MFWKTHFLARSCLSFSNNGVFRRWTYPITGLKRIPASPVCRTWGVGHGTKDVLSQTCAVLVRVLMERPFPPFFSQLKVLQSLMVRPVGLAIPNNCSLKCGRTFSFKKSLLEVKIVVSGYRLPRLVNELCVHNIGQSFAFRRTRQILTPAIGRLDSVTAVKMSLWLYRKIWMY